jgi:tetratricopeptide (TPR) repeat protein
MTRIRPIPVSLFTVMLLGVLTISAPAAEPSPWLEIHSTHFTVITDGGEKRGKEVALRFEQMRAVFALLLMKDRLNEPRPLTILAFKNDKNYYQCAPLKQGQPIEVPGFFVPSDDQNFIVLNLFEVEPWRAVAHDFAHLLMNYNYPPVEGWFDEGLVEYFSSLRVDNQQVEIGSDPELNSVSSGDLAGNQRAMSGPPKSFTELLGGQVWLALPDLLTLKHDTSTYVEGTHHTLYYAQSWITVHYLLHENKLPQTGTYFDLVENQRLPVVEAIQKAYGVTSDQFDRAVKDYFHSLTPLFTALDASKRSVADPRQVYHFPAPVGPNDSAITSKPMRENDAKALAAEVMTRVAERRNLGLQELQALATIPEAGASGKPIERKAARENIEDAPLVAAVGNEIAHRALAWDHLQHGEFDAAAEELSDAAILDQHDMWIRYYLAVMKYRIAQAKHTDIQGLPNMMQDLRGVLDWYPEFADAYDLMAMARKEGGGSIAAMQAEHAAIELSPRNQEYVYHLAEIYIEGKKWEAARALLERLRTSSDSLVATQAREQLTRLTNEQKYGLSTASTAPKLSPQSSPFDVLEQDARKRTAAEQTAQNAGVGDRRAAKFLQGLLVRVDCSHSPAAVLTVAAGGTTLKLRTADYKSLLLIGTDQFSCTWSDRSVSVNYKPGGLSDGDLVSLEVR